MQYEVRINITTDESFSFNLQDFRRDLAFAANHYSPAVQFVWVDGMQYLTALGALEDDDYDYERGVD